MQIRIIAQALTSHAAIRIIAQALTLHAAIRIIAQALTSHDTEITWQWSAQLVTGTKCTDTYACNTRRARSL